MSSNGGGSCLKYLWDIKVEMPSRQPDIQSWSSEERSIPAPPASSETESHPSSHLLPRKQPPPTITQYPRKKLTFLFVCLYLLFIILLFVYVWEKSRIVGSVPRKTDFETDIYWGALVGTTPVREWRKDWTVKEVEVQSSCKRGLSPSHGELWTWDGPSEMSWTEARGWVP